jgi:hypothetical protein
LTTPPEVEAGGTCPQCGGPAEPEQDGLVVYLACADAEGCGAEFGYRPARQAGPACAAGLPLPGDPGPPVIAATITMRRPE